MIFCDHIKSQNLAIEMLIIFKFWPDLGFEIIIIPADTKFGQNLRIVMLANLA